MHTRILSLTFALIALASPARAELIMWQFSGQFTTGSETFSIAGGDTFSFTVGIDTDSYFRDGFTQWVGFGGHVGSNDIGTDGGGRFWRAFGDDNMIGGELHGTQPILTGDHVGPNNELIPFAAFINMQFAPGALDPRGTPLTHLPDPVSIGLDINYARQPSPDAPLNWNPGPYLRVSTTNIARVPEPTTLMLLGIGLLGARSLRRKTRTRR